MRAIKDADYLHLLEFGDYGCRFKMLNDVEPDLRRAIKKMKLDPGGRPTEIELNDKLGVIFKAVDILGMVTSHVEITLSDADAALIRIFAEAMGHVGVPPEMAERVNDYVFAKIPQLQRI